MQTNLKRDYVWNTAGTLLQSFTSPVLLVVIAHVNGQFDVGLFSFAFAVAVAFWVVAMWGGRTYQVSDVKSEFSQSAYITTRVLLIFITVFITLLFCWINQYPLDKSTLILALVGFKCIESISDVYYGVVQLHNKLYIAGISLMLKATFGVLAFVIVDSLTKNILLASFVLIAINIIVFLMYDLRWIRRLNPIQYTINNTTFYSLIMQSYSVMRKSFPVFIVSFMVTFSLNIPRFFIDIFHPQQNPFFGVMAMPVTLVLLVITFLIQPNIVKLSKLYNDVKLDEFNKIIKNISLVVLFVGIAILGGTYIFGVPILNIVFNIDFSPYKLELLIIVIGSILNAYVAIGVNTLTIVRRFKALVYTLLLSNLALLAASYYIVNLYGMLGGTYLFMAAGFVQSIILFYVQKRVIREKVLCYA